MLASILLAGACTATCQQLQLHYDLRHLVDPMHTTGNFPALYFEYFKTPGPDSNYGTLKPGSFLIKSQCELSGSQNNIGQFYIQVSQAFRMWKPKVYVQLQYNGGLGIAEPGSYGYYLNNAFSLGAAYSFQWGSRAFFNISSSYKYTAFKRPSHDNISAFFWLYFFPGFRSSLTGNLVVFSENRNHGDAYTNMNSGKKVSLYSDPQAWVKIYRGLSLGSRLSIYYHLISEDKRVQLYPSLAARYQF
jgi:hypothetical protein